ncbi:hypothetical protein [Bradyrhizobium sp. AUGA SZCCT0182]|uniref:hypothetical protein n=1 Tax=Bradyrhizobium sp. AUGA SZCCT0182 TaxID=2807667 RepID=UPI001BA88702|nr:hypothetical protein [Bradyrhizobium sp. AUGA SZCCT0182]MBR1237733.1 hypothetical protein [Bradyrhizobium sp. AUGA SZCCT0182]
MSRAVSIPLGSWPLEMTADIAAGYCGEPSTDAFLAKVAKGHYPQPIKCKGMLPKWHRFKLDAAIAQRHGLQVGASLIAEDVTALI